MDSGYKLHSIDLEFRTFYFDYRKGDESQEEAKWQFYKIEEDCPIRQKKIPM